MAIWLCETGLMAKLTNLRQSLQPHEVVGTTQVLQLEFPLHFNVAEPFQ